ncbi:uncharacterized protein LOC135819541 isoform X1 [Sycon ciliatum]|uniref:uncharacterized protein LOC135819541 isoform X1 n=1 Tax=Sycon ciliatum TaxID=27933 RepID=UPI0031F713A3
MKSLAADRGMSRTLQSSTMTNRSRGLYRPHASLPVLLGSLIVCFVACGVTSEEATVGPKTPGIAIFVVAWSDANHGPPGNDSEEDLRCSSNNHCESLWDAMKLARNLQSQQQQQLNAGGVQSPLPIVVRLLANQTLSQCRVLLRRRVQLHHGGQCTDYHPIGVELLDWHMADIIVDGSHPAGGCGRSLLAAPTPLSQSAGSKNTHGQRSTSYLLDIVNSSAITFRNIAIYAENITDVYWNRSLVHIQSSRLIRFVDCVFTCMQYELSGGRRSLAMVRDSAFVAFSRCTFQQRKQMALSARVVENAILSTRISPFLASALDIELMSVHRIEDLSAAEHAKLSEIAPSIDVANCTGGGRIATTGSTGGPKQVDAKLFYCLPSLLLHHCSVANSGRGVKLDYAPHRLRKITISTAVPMAIGVTLSSMTGHRVLIHSCDIKRTQAPLGTSVKFSIAHDRRNPPSPGPANSTEWLLEVTNTSFEGNIGLFGGALMVLADRKASFMGNVFLDDRYSRSEAMTACNLVLVKDCYFGDNLALREGGGILVHFKTLLPWPGSLVFVHLHNVTFSRNRAMIFNLSQPGGALTVVSDGESSYAPSRLDNSTLAGGLCQGQDRKYFPVQLCNVTMSDNRGIGALFARSTNMSLCGVSSFLNNTGSAVVLLGSRLVVRNTLHIIGNRGVNGGVFSIRDVSSVTLAQVKDLVARDNRATYLGSIAHADSRSSSFSAYEAFFSKLNRTSVAEACPFILPLHFVTGKSQSMLQTFFSGSKADVPGKDVSTIFMASLFSCLDNYKPVMAQLTQVDDPFYCMPYAPARWELYSGEVTGANKDYCGVLEQFSSSGPCLEGCEASARGLQTRVTCAFGNYTLSESLHRGNGTTVSANTRKPWQCWPKQPLGDSGDEEFEDRPASPPSLSNPLAHPNMPYKARKGVCPVDGPGVCTDPNPYLRQPPSLCHSRVQQITVVNWRSPRFQSRIQMLQSPFGSNVAWLFFNSTTTACYKVVGDRVWYFYDGCSRDKVWQNASNSRERLPLETDCWLLQLAQRNHEYRGEVLTGIVPGYRYVLTPWASYMNTWNGRAGINLNKDNRCVLESPVRRNQSLHWIGNLTLQPAPGEEFELSIQALDESFGQRVATLLVSVSAEHDDVVLGRLGFVFKHNKHEVFTSTKPMRGLRLFGRPGARGHLVISVKDRLTFTDTFGVRLTLRIPFHLRECHFGYYKWQPSLKKAVQLIQVLNMATTSDDVCQASTDIRDTLGCKCFSDKYASCMKSCSNREVLIKSHCWAGGQFADRPSTYEEDAPYRIKEQFTMSTTEFFEYNTGDPLGKAQHNDNMFTAQACSKDSCAYHNGSKYWMLGQDNPCSLGTRTTGPLCSTCLKDYWSSLGLSFCERCTGGVPIGVFLLVLFIAVTIAFIVVLLLNIGVTPPLDSWLFYCHVNYCINNGFHTTRSFYTNFITLGAAKMCIMQHMSPMLRQTLLMCSPLMSMTLVIVLYTLAARRVGLRVLQRLQQRKSIRHVAFFIILWTSGMLSYQALVLMRCMPLGDGPHVLVIDSTVICFQGVHIYYMAMTLFIIAVFVLPPPILLAWRPTHIFPSLVGMIDEATCMYEPSCQWWAVFNLLRRIVFSCIVATVTEGLTARMILLMLMITQVALHGYVRPYCRDAQLWKIKDVDNIMEFVVLTFLTIMAAYRILQVDIPFGPSRTESTFAYSLFAIISFLLFVSYASRFTKSWWDTLRQHPRQSLKMLWTEVSDDEEAALAAAAAARNSHPNMTLEMLARSRQHSSHGCRNGLPAAENSCAAATPPPPAKLNSHSSAQDDEAVDTKLQEPLLMDYLLEKTT